MENPNDNVFEELAQDLETDLRIKGYLSSDIATLAYFLLRNNAKEMEYLEKRFNDTNELFKKVEAILNGKSDNE